MKRLKLSLKDWAGLIAIVVLIVSNVISCNKNPKVEETVITTCDTVRIEIEKQPLTVAEIPKPIIKTTVRPNVIHVNDTVFIKEKVFVYDTIISHPQYDFRYRLKTYSPLSSFEYSIIPKLQVLKTNNIYQKEIHPDRNNLLLFEGMSILDFQSFTNDQGLNPSYYGSLTYIRTNRAVVWSVGYIIELKKREARNQGLKLGLGLRF